MGAWAGPYFAVSGVLLVAGLLKLRRPATAAGALAGVGLPRSVTLARLVGGVEAVAGAGALAAGTALFSWLVAACYLGFAIFVVVLLARRTPAPDCGCFGGTDDPPTVAHVIVDAAALGVALAVALGSPAPLTGVLRSQPYLGLPFLALTATAAWLGYTVLTTLPRTLRLASSRP